MAEYLTEYFTFTMTSEEKAMLRAIADKSGMSMTKMLRKLIREAANRRHIKAPDQEEGK